MKKITILLLLVILLTGCSAEVNIIINDTGINETVTINDTSTSSYYNYVPVFYEDIFSDIEPDVKNEGVSYYNKNVTQDVSGYKINYSYKYTVDEYKRARSVKTSFQSFNIRESKVDEEIVISTSTGGIKYFDKYTNLDSVKINITPSYKVLENNADYVNGNVYTWVFTKNTKKHIYMVLDNPNESNSTNNSTTGNNGTTNNNSNNNNNGNDVSTDDNEQNNNQDDEEYTDDVDTDEDEDKKESFLDKYPYVILFGAIVIFAMFVIILVKVSKSD